jgi:hypothetical protein
LMSLFGGSPTSSLLGGFPAGGANPLSSGITPVGANPYNPLQGQPAVAGIGQFIKSVQTTSALRKAGLLPPAGQPGAAGIPGAGGGGDLPTLLASLMQQISALAGGGAPAGGAAAPPAGAGLNLLA